MAHKKEHLEGLLKLIETVSRERGNEWFVAELSKRFGNQTAAGTLPDRVELLLKYMQFDIVQEELLEFDFLAGKYPFLYQQLFFDQLNMLRARYGIGQKKGVPNFKTYCSLGHLQLEGLLNAYFNHLESNNLKLLQEVHIWTSQIALQPADIGFYKGKITDNNKKTVYYNQLEQTSLLPHQDKYREQALESFALPSQDKIGGGYSRKRYLFANLHQFHFNRFGVKKAERFDISKKIYEIRNLDFHRGLKFQDEEVQAFIKAQNFGGVYDCLYETTAIIKAQMGVPT